MNSASRVQIAKIKVGRDKFGQKYCRVELRRTVDEHDQDTPAVAIAIRHMQANAKVTKTHLGLEMKACNLTFFGSPNTQPSDAFAGVEAWNFRLKREHPGSIDATIALSFDFVVSLELAKRWLIPAIGDDILCVIEDAQLSFKSDSQGA